jgi:hypothetical protein
MEINTVKSTIIKFSLSCTAKKTCHMLTGNKFVWLLKYLVMVFE